MIDGWGISCEIALIWMSLDFTDDQWTSVQVLAWCHQATSHYLSYCLPRSLSPHGVTRPEWVNPLAHERCWSNFTSASFKIILQIDILSAPSDIGLSWVPENLTDGKSTLVQVMAGLHWWSVNIGSGNGLVPSGNKPLPEPMLTQIFVATWCHWARMS